MASALEEHGDASYSELCKICLRTKSKYTCPRCNTPYCSLECYKSEVHLDCSESFYQEWVENELKASKISSEGRKKMLNILQGMNNGDTDLEELDSDDDCSLPDLADRLNGVNLDDADEVWGKLSEVERNAFKELLNSGEAANLIASWEPWWLKRYEEPKVQLVGSDLNVQQQVLSHIPNCPKILPNINSLSLITNRKPNNSVLYDLINILGSYSMVVRYYNGSHFDFPLEAASVIYHISQSLGSPQNFSCFVMALEAVGLKAIITDGLETDENNINIMKNDVKSIVNGPSREMQKFYILASISDIHSLISSSNKKQLSGKFSETFKPVSLNLKSLDKKIRYLCLKRIEYFLSFSISYDFTEILQNM